MASYLPAQVQFLGYPPTTHDFCLKGFPAKRRIDKNEAKIGLGKWNGGSGVLVIKHGDLSSYPQHLSQNPVTAGLGFGGGQRQVGPRPLPAWPSADFRFSEGQRKHI